MAITWTTSGFTFPSTFDFVDVCWADTLGLFVAVGQNWSSPTTSCVMTSPDGNTWTQQTGIAHNWIGVCWSSSLTLLVAVAATGHVMTSPDGVTWTARTAAAASDWRSVCWAESLGLFVAVGQSVVTRVMTSPDGITWTGHAGLGGGNWSSVCWSEDLGVLIAAMDNSGTQRLAKSTDGSTWTLVTTPSVTSWIPGGIGGSAKMCWSSALGLFVGIGQSGSPGAGDWQFYTSPDGSTWTARTTPADGLGNRTPKTVVFDVGDALFVATGGATVRESSDGITWTTDGSSGEASMSLAYGKEVDALVGTNATTFVSSAFLVTSITPATGFDLGGTAVTITGANFGGTMLVNFDNVEATNIVVVSDTTITCDTPAHVAGVVTVTVTKALSGAYRQLVGGYTYTSTGFDPSSGGGAGLSPDHGPMTGGTSITITGVNLQAGYDIFFDGVIATSIVHVSDTEYTCVTPSHAVGLVDVIVGPYTVADAFTYDELTAGEFSGGIRREPSISIHDTSHVAGDVSFSTDESVAPTAGKDTTIDFGSGTVHTGTILQTTTTYEEQTDQLVHHAVSSDFTWLLNARRPFGSWTNVSGTTVINEMMADSAPDFTTTGVQVGMPNVTITLNGSVDFAGALTAVIQAMGVGGGWYLNVKDLHAYFTPEGGGIDPDTVTDDTPTLQKNPAISETEDVAQVRNRVFGIGAGATIIKSAPIGATVLELDNIDNFESGGGRAIVGSNRIAYTGKGRVSEVVYRANAPSSASSNITNQLAGVIQGGEIRDVVTYKFSTTGADGQESSISQPVSPSYGIPNILFGPESLAVNTLAGGSIDAGQYNYIIGVSGPGGANNGATGENGSPFNANVTVGANGSKVTLNFGYYSHPSNDPRADTLVIYRTKKIGSETPTRWYQIASVPNINLGGAVTITDVLNDASLSGANPNITVVGGSVPIATNLTGTRNYIDPLPARAAGVTLNIYRSQGFLQPENFKKITSISDHAVTSYEDNAATTPPAFGDFQSGSPDQSVNNGEPPPLPPIIHLVLTGVSGVTKAVTAPTAISVFAEAENVAAQIDLATRRGGSGIREYTVTATNMKTAELQARVNAEVTLFAFPIKTIRYGIRDPKHQAGRNVTFNVVNPPITGTYRIQEVAQSQIHEGESDGIELEPLRTCVASSVRFTLDDLLHHVRIDDNENSGTSGGTVSSGGSTSGVSPRTLTVVDDDDVTLVASAGAAVAVLADTTLTAGLSETGVTAGAYTSANITVDAKGRITAAASGTGGGTVTTTGTPASGNLAKFSGATSVTNGDLSGDVTTAGTLAATIANDAVTNTKAANMAQSTVKGRAAAAGTGDPTDLTPNQVSTILDAATDPFVRTSASTSGITELTSDVTAGPGTGSQAATIANDAVTNAKAANMAADTLKGRAHGAGTGDPTDLSANQASTILDTATDPFVRTSASGSGITQLTSDVTAGPGTGSQAATIANDAVTNAKAANMVQSTIKGRAVGAGTGDPTDLTATQATAILDNFVGDSGAGGTKGLVPAPAAGDAAAGKFLKADGTFAVPSGSSGVSALKVAARIALGV